MLLPVTGHFNSRRRSRGKTRRAMNTEQLKGMLNRYKCLRNTLIDITAINTLPKDVPSIYPQLYIVNTDPLPNPGKHWVCVILYNYDKADYFDSLGRTAEYYGDDLQNSLQRNSQNHSFMQRRLQSVKSDVCGIYVVYFAVMSLCLYVPMRDVFDGFHANDFEQNDRFICMFFFRNVMNVFLLL